MFPHEVSGLDAAIDSISDLEWFGNDGGYLVVARGLAELSPVADSFGSILPNIVDAGAAEPRPSWSPSMARVMSCSWLLPPRSATWSALAIFLGSARNRRGGRHRPRRWELRDVLTSQVIQPLGGRRSSRSLPWIHRKVLIEPGVTWWQFGCSCLVSRRGSRVAGSHVSAGERASVESGGGDGVAS